MRFERSSGILLHPTSLPGNYGIGDLGAAAYHFVDWLVVAGQKIWQMLPVGPVGMGNSPYMSFSAFAGSPLLVDLDDLAARGWLDKTDLEKGRSFSRNRVDYPAVIQFRQELLERAANGFCRLGTADDKSEFESFCDANAHWLEEYGLFMAFHDKFGGSPWNLWEKEVARRYAKAIRKRISDLRDSIQMHKFIQWSFGRQWKSLKKYANDRQVKLIGDIPIFVAHNSADVWSNPESYYLDNTMHPNVVAGVPPDYFSRTGQRWGNPLYRWDVMKKNGYAWWVERFRAMFQLFDIVRIDHFRGFVAYWEIPASEKTAEHGRWVEGPKDDLFHTVLKRLGRLPIIAEDLGFIVPEVHVLRDQFQFPGMKILQFAFGSGTDNPFLPHRYISNCVVYTGTHDNDTTCGWFLTANDQEKSFMKKYINVDSQDIHWTLMRLGSQSVADLSIFPLQDVLGLGKEARMNYPGKSLGNWEWRFTWDQVKPDHAQRLHELSVLYERYPPQ
ncbi:MAG: 4-alpha-glucanotransferase [Ignavibacteriales bacterium]|nr:4-alpha-glucanotransferase [Ignavibacteriales bacterium]